MLTNKVSFVSVDISESVRPEEGRGAGQETEERPGPQPVPGPHCQETLLKVQKDSNKFRHEWDATEVIINFIINVYIHSTIIVIIISITVSFMVHTQRLSYHECSP